MFVWPDIYPIHIIPPEPCFYLTWPAWEEFWQENLEPGPVEGDLTPLELFDPPNFKISLAILLNSAGFDKIFGILTSLFSNLPNTPVRDQESTPELVRALRGDPALPKTNQWAGNPDRVTHDWGIGDMTGRSADPAYLVLSLWACAKTLAQQADDLLFQAMDRHQSMMEVLLGDQSEVDLSQQTVRPEPQPVAMKGIFSAWLKLAGPLLTPEDRLWTPIECDREFAVEALALAPSVKARLWPGNSDLI